MAERHELKRLQAIRDGDGSEIREQYVYAGLLLTIFERFKDYLVGQVDSFFSDHIEIRVGEIHYKRGEEFKELMRQKGVGLPGQHANKAFRAALHWVFELGAITKEEFDDVERIYILRNDIGHELFGILADDNKAPIALEDVLTAFGVYLKVTRWWVKEVDAIIDPEFDQKSYDQVNWDEVESGDTVFLREIILKALLGSSTLEELEGLIAIKQNDPATS